MTTMPADSTSWIPALRNSALETLSSGQLWIGLAVGGLLVAAGFAITARRRYRASSMTVSLPFGLGSVTYEASSDDRVIAWRMYVQLKTRKAALPFDEAHDVVADVYSSLYELFPVARDLLSGMQLGDIARPKGVAEVILRTLNDGLRPHLTRWNACYRRWWEQQVEEKPNDGKTPQQVQQQYPQYKELVDDLKATNTELSRFADELLAIARAYRGKQAGARPTPTPPTILRCIEQTPAVSEKAGESGVTLPTTPYDSAENVPEKDTAQGGAA